MKLTPHQQDSFDTFISLMNESPTVDKIVTVFENVDCGLYVRQNGEFKDIPCFAVAKTISDGWFGLSRELELYYFEAGEIV